MTPTEHVEAAKRELEEIRSAEDYDRWHDKWAWGEAYICLPEAELRQVENLAEIGRHRAMSFTFPIMAG